MPKKFLCNRSIYLLATYQLATYKKKLVTTNMASPIVPILITTLHNIFTALWIGGMLTLAFAVFPSIKKVFGKSKEMKQTIAAIKKRMSIFVYISMVGLILTGLLMTKQSGLSTGFLSFGNTFTSILSTKHILYILMIILRKDKSWQHWISTLFHKVSSRRSQT